MRELDYVMTHLKLKGVQILTNVDGKELSDPAYAPFLNAAKIAEYRDFGGVRIGEGLSCVGVLAFYFDSHLPT